MEEELKELLRKEAQLKLELKEIRAKIREIRKKDPYRLFAKEYEQRMGICPRLSRATAKRRIQKRRLDLVNFLMNSSYTKENPIELSELAKKLGYSPSELWSVIGEDDLSPERVGVIGWRYKNVEMYVKNGERANVYASLVKKLLSLP